MHPSTYIPFNRPDIGEEEITEVVSTLRSGWLTTGERTGKLRSRVPSLYRRSACSRLEFRHGCSASRVEVNRNRSRG